MATLSLAVPPRPRGGLAYSKARRPHRHKGVIGDLCKKIDLSIYTASYGCRDKCIVKHMTGAMQLWGRTSVGLELDAVNKMPAYVGHMGVDIQRRMRSTDFSFSNK